MTYQTLYEILAVAAFVILLIVLGAVFRAVNSRLQETAKSIQYGQGAQVKDRVPIGAENALRAAIYDSHKMRAGEMTAEETEKLWEELRINQQLLELTIHKQYIQFSLAKEPESKAEALKRLAEVIQEGEKEDGMLYLYQRLYRLQLDLESEDDRFHLLRETVDSLRPITGKPRDGLTRKISAMHSDLTQLASLAEQNQIARDGSEKNLSFPRALEKSELKREYERFSHRLEGQGGDFLEAECELLKKAARWLFVSFQNLVPGGESELAGAGGKTPETNMTKTDEGSFTVDPAVLFVPVFGREISKLELTLTNESNQAADRAVVRVGYSPVAGPAEQLFEEIRIEWGLVKSKAKKRVEVPLPSLSAEGRIRVTLDYRDAEGRSRYSELEIPVSIVDPRDALCPYANRSQQASSYFVGRQGALEHLRKWALSDEEKICVVSGIPNIGKSALLYEIQKRASQREDGWDRFRVAILNLHQIRFNSPDWPKQFLALMMDAIVDQVQVPRIDQSRGKGRHADEVTFEGLISFLERVAARLESQSLRLLIMIDEFNRIEEISKPEAQAHKRDLVGLFRKIGETFPKMLIVLAGYFSLRYLFRRSGQVWRDTVGKVAIGKELELGLLASAEAMDLIVKPMWKVGLAYKADDNVPEEFLKQTAGYPVTIHELGMELFQEMERRHLQRDGEESLEIDISAWSKVYSAYLARPHTMLDRLWAGGLDEVHEAVAVAIAQSEPGALGNESEPGWIDRRAVFKRFGGFPSLSEPNFMLRCEELVERKILEKTEVEGNAYLRIKIPLLRDRLKIHGDIELMMVGDDLDRKTSE